MILDDDGRVLASLDGLRCAAVTTTRDPYADCGYQLEWRLQPTATERAGASAGDAWIVLGDGGATSATLVETLRRRGLACALLDVDQRSALVRRIDAGTRGVVFCAGLDAAPLDSVDDLRARLRETWAAIELTRAVIDRGLRDPPQLCFVTRGAQSVDGELVAPEWAPLWGMARTLALEHPELECKRIDLAPAPSPGELTRLAEELLAVGEEREVALRERGRFVARLGRARLAQPDADTDTIARIRADATYWITGGLGGLGLELARWLAERGAGHVVLTSRGGPSESTRAAIETIEGTGTRVHVLTGDVSRMLDVSRVLSAIREELPPLRGVAHAAAVVRDRTLARVEEPDFWAPLEPKAIGAWNLHHATRDLELDFFALYSSQVAALGALGQAVYGAGNAFLDGLARARAAAGLPGTSVQWGTFADVGMTTALADQGDRLAALGFDAFAPAELGALFSRALAHPQPVLGLARLSIQRWIEAHPQASGSPRLVELLREDQATSSSGAISEVRERVAGILDAARDEQLARVESIVVEQLSRSLRLAPARVDRREPFSRLGLDSLMSLELRGRLERALDLRLPPTLCFTYPTVHSLAEYLLTRLRDANASADDNTDDEGADETFDEGADDLLGDDDDDDGDDDDVLAAFDATMRDLEGGMLS